MKKLVSCLVSGFLMVMPVSVFAAGSTEISWDNPQKYTDVKPVNESRKRFRERTFNKLGSYVQELAQDLPQGQTLRIKVSDLDLAGQVWPGSFVGMQAGYDVRLVKRGDIPRMDFDFSLTDSNGKVLKQGAVELKDMSFQSRARSSTKRNDNLRYEKIMLKKWFNKEFSDSLEKADS